MTPPKKCMFDGWFGEDVLLGVVFLPSTRFRGLGCTVFLFLYLRLAFEILLIDIALLLSNLHLKHGPENPVSVDNTEATATELSGFNKSNQFHKFQKNKFCKNGFRTAWLSVNEVDDQFGREVGTKKLFYLLILLNGWAILIYSSLPR